jgi:two-component system, NtrC family, sensor kinase
MSLKKKIVLSFFISAFIIAVLAAFEYFSFVEIKKEIRYLEITDTISRKSLQLRRHEKNFFLYSPQKMNEESAAVHAYLAELNETLAKNPGIDRSEQLSLRDRINEYGLRFASIDVEAKRLSNIFEKAKASYGKNGKKYFSLVEATFLERPVQSAEFLERVFSLPHGHVLLTGLRALDADILALRKTGEEILVISKDLDKIAREKAETVIRVSQMAILILFPIFFIVGIGMLFFISTNVVKRLMLLINVMERTGRGSYPHLSVPPSRGNAADEVGVLIEKFNTMEDELSRREMELERKNKELIQTRKLAALGTLAAGVAHELNNPLNNIHLSAQVLAKQAGTSGFPELHEAVSDILGQTVRVKRIVGDLLEFARGREPSLQGINLAELIDHVYKKLTVDTSRAHFSLDAEPPAPILMADPELMEQVFINLFTNAVEAMPNGGTLVVKIRNEGEAMTIRVMDSGKGMPKSHQEKVFEPFFTTKDTGTGLGLAIVFNIVRKHYGAITMESDEGKGTTFTITLPRMGVTGSQAIPEPRLNTVSD